VGEALSVLRVGAAGADPSDVELFAHALEGDTVKTGSAVLASGETSDVTLETSGPRLIRDGEGIQQLPKGGVPLSLDWVIGKAQRPLRPRLGGGEIRRDARDPKGTYTVRGRDAKGKVVATLSLDLPAGRGVVLGGKKRVTRVAPGTKSVAGRVRVGGATTEGQQTFQIRAAEGELLQTNPGKALDWAARVPSGRYVIDAKGALPAPLGVTQLEPHVVLSQGLFGPSVLTLAPGEGGVLRLDLWPTVVSEEILEVRWSVGDAKAVARPRPGLPGQILLLPVFASETAKPGKRSVSATVVTARGNFEVKGRFSVKAGSARVEVTLMDVDGKPAATRALALGGKRVLRAVGVRNGNWILVGPAGVRALSPRFDGQVPFELDAGESEGTYTVWLSGQRGDAPVHGVLALRAFPSHVLEVPAPTQAVVGSTITLKIPVPGDFEPPLRARVGRGAWAKGAAVRVRVQAENVLEVALSDSLGRLAQGSVSFAGRRSKQAVPAKGPRFGIVANVHERKILAADYALISSYLQNGTLPKNLAVLERGPLTAAGVRDRVLKTFPFDGPVAGNQVVYRSKRFWKTLQRSALERFEELEVPVDSVFEIQNSPSPNGEFTLRDRVAQHLAKVGAWSYELTHVRVRADGLEPHSTQAEDPKIKARLNNASISKPNGGTVGRIVVPGPLADLELVSILPKQLDLAKGNRLLFSLAAKRKKLVKNPYPNDWQLLARKARICPELEVEMTAGGKTFKAAGRSLAKSAAGVDIGIVFEHLGTKRHEDLDQKPRKAEAHSVDVQTFGEAPSPVKLDFEPLNPGLLANEPKELVIVVRARQARAVSPSAWPEERDRPKAVRIEGVPFFFEEDDVRVSSLELVITYVRTAPGGPEPPARPGPDLGDLRAGGDPKPAPSVSAALKRGRKALAKSAFEGAEAAARRAVAGAPSDPRPWTLLAEIALARELPLLAMGRARWSLGCSPTPLAWAIVGEAAYAEGDLDTASAACKAGMRLKPEAAVKKRLERLKEEVE
jgi:hypothetical protein